MLFVQSPQPECSLFVLVMPGWAAYVRSLTFGELKTGSRFPKQPGGRRFWVSTGVEIWSLVGVCNLRANPPESDLKFQVGGVRQLNLRLRLRRENGLDIGVAEISLIFRCSAAVVSLLFPLSFGYKPLYFS